MTLFKKILPLVLFLFIALGILYLNPYGNNPDIVLDESYFLTSALSSVEKHTLPGWEFSASGAYYGGVQAYIDTFAVAPAIAIVFALSGFSLTATKIWVALNTGELLHILRLVSGILALAGLLACFFYFRRKNIPRELALTLALFLLLLLSNTLAVEFLHTAKMWALYITLIAISSAFFLAQEYYLARGDEPLMRKERYAALLIWGGILTFFQSYVGAFSSLLLLAYALILGHLTARDVWRHVRKYWWLMALASVTQISFIYRAYLMRAQFADVSTTVGGAIDWSARLLQPLIFAVQGQPLILLYPIGIVAVLVFALRHASFLAGARRRTVIAIAVAHPILTYLFFHVIVGFDILPRYAIMLTLACAFSATILISELGKRAVIAALTLATALSAVVLGHAITLYSHPSSEAVLLKTIIEKYNTPDTLFITDHSARRMTLPVNAESLLLLDEERQAMSRFTFLLQNRDRLPVSEFKPLTATAYRSEQEAEYLAQFGAGTHSVWMIKRLCTDRCSADETDSGTCFEINMNACGKAPQEVNTLQEFISATQLGYSYVVRKIR